MNKGDLRKHILKLRERMPRSEVVAMSDVIHARLQALPLFYKATTLMFYASTRNEVETDAMIRDALRVGKRVCLPLVQKGKKELKVSYIEDLDALTPGAYGIREPLPHLFRAVPIDSIDLIILPGLAFDMNGYRLGYGGGYYDRFLAKLGDNVPKIGLAFDFQILGILPIEAHDLKVDTIITEKRIITIRKEADLRGWEN